MIEQETVTGLERAQILLRMARFDVDAEMLKYGDMDMEKHDTDLTVAGDWDNNS